MSKQDLKAQAVVAGKSVDQLILDTVRTSETMDEAAKRLGVSRFTIVKRLEAMGLRAKSGLFLEKIVS
jgi:transcriptional regulator of acetoin/glycerol metabolism